MEEGCRIPKKMPLVRVDCFPSVHTGCMVEFVNACCLFVCLPDCKRIELLDIVFVLDHSGSIGLQQQESMINLTIHLVKKADVGRDRVQFGALKYSNNPEILFYLNTYSSRSAIIDHLRKPRSTTGETYTAKALQHSNILFTEEHGSRLKQDVRQLMIIITDGVSHDRERLNDTARELRDKGITVIAVGVGAANQDELETMAGKRENTIHVDNFDKLGDIYQSLQETLCNNSQESKPLRFVLIILFSGDRIMISSVIFTPSPNASQARLSHLHSPSFRFSFPAWVARILMATGATSLKKTDTTSPKETTHCT